MSRRPTPPRWAERLLAALLPAEDREAVLEEVAELYEIRCARRGVSTASGWYARQVLVFALQLARHGRRRGVRRGRSGFGAAVDLRDSGGGGVDMVNVLAELQQAAKRLWRAPVFTGVAVVTIGVGIGAFTSIFSLVDGVLLEPLPYRDAQELAWVWRDYVEESFPRGWLGGPDLVGLQERPDVFEGVIGFANGTLNLSGEGGGAPAQVTALFTTPGLFDLLGVPLQLGREASGREYDPDAPDVAVLSHELWRTQFGSDPTIVGRTIRLNDEPTEVIGIAPEAFRFVMHGSLVDPVAADLYMPLRTKLADTSPGNGSYAGLVRIAAGAHPDQVEAALAAAAEPVNAFMRSFDATPVRLWTVGLEADLVESARPGLIALIGSAAFLLLVLAANLATLLLGRAAVRERELGIRTALGAGRARILAGVVAESVLLAALGGLLGISLAFLGTDLVVSLAPDDLPRLGDVGVNASVLAVAILVTLSMALAAGVTPAAYALRQSVAAAVREGSPRAGGSVHAVRTRSFLVGAQVAVSLMLLVGAGVTVQAFGALLREDPGFDAHSTLTFRVPLPGSLYPTEAGVAFHDALRERISGLPGVTAVGASTALPLTSSTNQRAIAFPTAPGNTGDPRLDELLIDYFSVTPGYFTAAGHRLLAGRDFTELDGDTTTFNLIIDDVLANRFFPDGSAVGARAAFMADSATIVGVVDQARLYNVHEDDRGQVYLPYHLYPSRSLSYAVRTAVPPASLVPSVRALMADLDAGVPMASVRTLEQIVDDSLGQQRLSLTLIVAFALGALFLATLGIYGVVSNAVIRRTQEIGVRMALGASGESVIRLVLRQGLRPSLIGAGVGVVGALASSRVLEGVVVGVDPGSPLVYLAVGTALVGVASLASYLPARRATRIDPLESLRPS